MRILVVDDDPISRRILTKSLCDFGHIDTFSTGVEAKEALILSYEQCMPYDLLVIDGVLPDAFGWNIIKEIREKETAKSIRKPLNIIITSGFDDFQGISSKLNFVWMQKPIDINFMKEIASGFCIQNGCKAS